MHLRQTALWLKLGKFIFWLIWPLFWLYLRGSERTRVAIIHDGQLLVVHTWLGNGKWSLPGGGLHKSEDKIRGVLREVREETGIMLDAANVQLLTAEQYQADGFRFVCHYFVSHLATLAKVDTRGLEIARIAWLPINQLDNYPIAADVQTVRTYLDATK